MNFWVSLVPFYFYLFLKTSKNLQMLQQNRYNRGNKYLKWMKSNLKKNFLNWDILGFILLFFIQVSFFKGRILRLFVTLFFLNLIPFLGLLKNENLCYLLFIFWLYFNPFVVVLANIINIPVEKLINFYFKSKSLIRLKSFKNLEVI